MKHVLPCIDLESSNFFIDETKRKRARNWSKVYANVAMNLSKQGFIVFTSSHLDVRRELAKRSEDYPMVIITPSLEIKDQWIKKLEDRYNETKLDKDYRAYMNAKFQYEENVNDLLSTEGNFTIIAINNIDYDLEQLVRAAIDVYDNKIPMDVDQILDKDNNEMTKDEYLEKVSSTENLQPEEHLNTEN